MKQVLKFVERVAHSEASTILLEGESGTGKDVIAKFLHYHSGRRADPFLAINCAAIPETLLESELFGYEKGAFTDARAQKKGILELATGGTVFLDEIGDMPLALQAKLLRVLEDQCFRRLGGVKDIHVDLRVITATNRDLSEAIQQGRFRLDLYYRLNMIQIFIPPLRQRTEDILPLAYHFMKWYKRKLGREIKGFSPGAAEALVKHAWLGNVRELRKAVERALILEDTEWLQKSSLGLRPDDYRSSPLPQPSIETSPNHEGMSLGEAEKAMLLDTLTKADWNQTRAARLLKVTRDTLRYKMKKFNLHRE
jgi:transcriptional regulator with PAS, ATPase and Fis domain